MKFKLGESIDWDKVQWGVHQFSTESIIYRGTEEECIKYIDDRPELWDDAEVYWMTPDDPHYLKEGIYSYQTWIRPIPGAKQPYKTLTYGSDIVLVRSPYTREEFGKDWKRHIKKIIEWCQENNPGLIRLTHDFRSNNFNDPNSDEAFIAAIEDKINKGEYLLKQSLTEDMKYYPHDDYRFDENLNEMKEVRDYKGYEMRADYDVDPEDGNMSLVVHIYRNGKEVHQNEFGTELTFENFREARKWVDAHSSKCSLADKLKQFCSIMNRKSGGDPGLSVNKDEYGYYIRRANGHDIEEGKIYFDDNYSYDYVYYSDPDIDWYEVAEYFGENPEIGIKLKRDENGASIGIEDAPELYDLRKDYFIPFDSSPLSSGAEFDDGLEALISISDWIFGESLTDSEKEKLLDPYDCSIGFDESINEGEDMKFKVMSESSEEFDNEDEEREANRLAIYEVLKKMVRKFGNKPARYVLVNTAGSRSKIKFKAPNDYVALLSLCLGYLAPTSHNFASDWWEPEWLEEYLEDYPTIEALQEYFNEDPDHRPSLENVESLTNIDTGKVLYNHSNDPDDDSDDYLEESLNNPSPKIFKRLCKSKDKKLCDEACQIMFNWYNNEDAFDDFNTISDFIDFVSTDIYDMIDAATSSREASIVSEAIEDQSYLYVDPKPEVHYDIEEAGLSYNRSPEGLILMKADKSLQHVEVPEGVVAISKWVFSNSDLKSINLPESLKKIGEYTFEFCKGLSEIVIPKNVTQIPMWCFFGCNHFKITLSENIRFIDRFNFEPGAQIWDVTIRTVPGSYADDYAKKNNLKVEYININESKELKEKVDTMAFESANENLWDIINRLATE